MKVLLLLFLLLNISLTAALAQDNNWFKGTWQGERSFPGSQITEATPVTMEIDKVNGSVFGGFMQYRLPGDTSVKLIRRISGTMYRRYIIITDWVNTYAEDKKYNTLWSTCAGCPGSASFSIYNDDLLLKITAGCSGDCKGEMIFSRQLNNYDAATQASLIQQFAPGTPSPKAPVIKASPVAAAAPRNIPSAKDSVKQFPTLLHNGMGIDFDASKYKTLPPLTTDTGAATRIQPGMQPIARTQTATPKTADVKKKPTIEKSNRQPDTAVANKTPAPAIQPADQAPQKEVPAIATLPAAIAPEANNPPAKTETDTTVAAAALPPPAKDTLPAAIVQRATSLITSYEVTSPHITVQLFDDGQIDGDAVSVYYNDKLIINNQTLTHKAITFTIDATASNRHHEFILISESEGFIAPNTALLRIKAGSQQFELTVSSNSATNAKIAIDYTSE